MLRKSIFSLVLLLWACSAWAEQAPASGFLKGTVLLGDGQPMPGGKLVVFLADSGPPPYPSRYLRPPDETADIDDDGRFSVALPPGRYYLTAIYKPDQDLIGPPVAGDYVFPGPLSLQQGQSIYPVKPGETTDIGTVTAIRFSKDDLSVPDDLTVIEGAVLDPAGNPVAGAIVFAFTSPNVVGKPLFISEKTGTDGAYQLRVSEGGTYYLKMRTALRGGHPEEGELIGTYGLLQPAGVAVATGETVRGIDIRAKEFVNYRKDPARARQKPDNAPQAPQRPGQP